MSNVFIVLYMSPRFPSLFSFHFYCFCIHIDWWCFGGSGGLRMTQIEKLQASIARTVPMAVLVVTRSGKKSNKIQLICVSGPRARLRMLFLGYHLAEPSESVWLFYFYFYLEWKIASDRWTSRESKAAGVGGLLSQIRSLLPLCFVPQFCVSQTHLILNVCCYFGLPALLPRDTCAQMCEILWAGVHFFQPTAPPRSATNRKQQTLHLNLKYKKNKREW